jgi:uncharacterized protein YegP (UPF0339 family)
MRNRLLGFAVLAVAVTSLTVANVDGQGKTKKTVEPAVTGEVEIYKNKEGKYRYKILGADGKTIAMPLPQLHWDTKAECLKAIDDLKSILNTAKPTEVDTKAKDTK